MSERAQAILAQVAGLSEDERAEIAECILLGLNATPGEAAKEQDWLAEVKRRADEMDQGLVEGVPWESVRADGEKLLRGQG